MVENNARLQLESKSESGGGYNNLNVSVAEEATEDEKVLTLVQG
jgi:hypothetical protein